METIAQVLLIEGAQHFFCTSIKSHPTFMITSGQRLFGVISFIGMIKENPTKKMT